MKYPKQLSLPFGSLKGKDRIQGEIQERYEINKRLAALRNVSCCCRNCTEFSETRFFSTCKLKSNKQVKFYNLCEFWKEKQNVSA